jgi:transcriptional regulator with XRE-family HTH domain
MTLTALAPASNWTPEWTFADRCRRVRIEMRLSQIQMAQLLGVAAPAYSAYESGRNMPRDPIGFAQTMYQHTGVAVWWMLGIDPDTLPARRRARKDSNLRPRDYQVAGSPTLRMPTKTDRKRPLNSLPTLIQPTVEMVSGGAATADTTRRENTR